MSLYKYNNETKEMWLDDPDEPRRLSNFLAVIVTETKYIETDKVNTVFEIAGIGKDGAFPPVELAADEFSGMSWVLDKWGASAQIGTGSSTKDHLRAAILERSTPKKATVYTEIGWREIHGAQAYVHAGGAISATGNDSSVRVQLPKDLENYTIASDHSAHDGIYATLLLHQLGPKPLMWCGIATTFAPVLGVVDWSYHITGKTGTFKSEISALWQRHYGKTMNARNLPGSWFATVNAIEALAWKCKDALFTIDDFVPRGTSQQQRTLHSTAARILQEQGNKGGRTRMNDQSNLQTTMFPRGAIISTGEDTPDEQSARARTMLIDIAPGTIKPAELKEAQKRGDLYVAGMAAFIQWVAANPIVRVRVKQRQEELRDKYQGVGHSRTPDIMGQMIATLEEVLTFAVLKEAIGTSMRTKLIKEATEAIVAQGNMQSTYLEETDPVDATFNAIRAIIESKAGHFRTVQGGAPGIKDANGRPTAAPFGWQNAAGTEDDMPNWKPQGKLLGWVDMTESDRGDGDKGELYLNMDTAYQDIKRFSSGKIAVTQPVLIKRLVDGNAVLRHEDNRGRNTTRVTAEGQRRTVVVLSPGQVLGFLSTEEDSDE